MSYLLNENIPLEAVQELRKAEIDLIWVRQWKPQADDDEILFFAAEQEHILITFDKDFGELVFHEGKPVPKGVILLRIPPKSPQYIARKLKELLTAPDLEFEGHFASVSEYVIRFRPLPKRG